MKSRGGGYTILEVLIFVTLTSFLLIVAIATVNGNRRNVEFIQGVRDFEGQVSDIINDVPNGYFPTTSNIQCSAAAAGAVGISVGAGNLGESEECIYIGKAMQFSPDGKTNEVLTYSIAGRRYEFGTTIPVKDLGGADPAAAALTAGTGDIVDLFRLVNGVAVTKVFNAADTSAQYGIIGILTNFEGSTSTGIVSEGQTVRIGGLSGSVFGSETKADAINDLKTLDESSFETAAGGIVVCLQHDNAKRASVTIGADGGSDVRLAVRDATGYNTGCN